MYVINETPREAWAKMVEYFGREDAVIATQPPSEGAQCRYRVGNVPDGPACAVGCLIPDEHYDPQIDNNVGTVLSLVRGGIWRCLTRPHWTSYTVPKARMAKVRFWVLRAFARGYGITSLRGLHEATG